MPGFIRGYRELVFMSHRFFTYLLLYFVSLVSFAPVDAKPKGYLPPSPLWKKLKSIIIDKIEFEDASPLEVFKYLRVRAKALDPEGKGVNFVFKGLQKNKSLITIKLTDIPLSDAVKYVCLTGKLAYKVDTFAVIIMPMPPVKKESAKKARDEKKR